MIGLSPDATGAGNIDALAKDEIDSANAAVKAKVLNTLRPPELGFLEGVMINESLNVESHERHRNAAVIEHSCPRRRFALARRERPCLQRIALIRPADINYS
jgi:hypothetical protein